MESLLSIGFPIALAWKSMVLCLLGTLIGILLGATQGIAPMAVAALYLTYDSSSTNSIALLAGLYYGGQFGRSASAVLFGVPGGVSALATTYDGHSMASRGQAGRALGTTLIALVFGCTVATVFIAVLAAPMSGLGLVLGPPEFVAITILSLAIAVAVAGGAPAKALVMVFVGLLLARVGTDVETGDKRLTFGLAALEDGLSGYAVALGLIVFPAILGRIEAVSAPMAAPATVGSLRPRIGDLRQTASPMLRGSLVGMLLGLLPMGPLLAPFAAYRIEQLVAADRTSLGSGAIEGVAAPEAANNAGAQAALISLFTFGLSHDTVSGLMLGTLTMFSVVPGPTIAAKSPEVLWGSIAMFWIASLMVLGVGMGLVGGLVKLLLLPRRYVLLAFLLIGCTFAYLVDTRLIDVAVAVLLGLAAYGGKKRGFEPMPALMGFLLGHMLEDHLRRMLMITRGNLTTIVERPISGVALFIALLVLAGAFWGWLRQPKGAAPS